MTFNNSGSDPAFKGFSRVPPVCVGRGSMVVVPLPETHLAGLPLREMQDSPEVHPLEQIVPAGQPFGLGAAFVLQGVPTTACTGIALCANPDRATKTRKMVSGRIIGN